MLQTYRLNSTVPMLYLERQHLAAWGYNVTGHPRPIRGAHEKQDAIAMVSSNCNPPSGRDDIAQVSNRPAENQGHGPAAQACSCSRHRGYIFIMCEAALFGLEITSSDTHHMQARYYLFHALAEGRRLYVLLVQAVMNMGKIPVHSYGRCLHNTAAGAGLCVR